MAGSAAAVCKVILNTEYPMMNNEGENFHIGYSTFIIDFT